MGKDPKKAGQQSANREKAVFVVSLICTEEWKAAVFEMMELDRCSTATEFIDKALNEYAKNHLGRQLPNRLK